MLGIPVLTAGTGRYDRRGFTIDSNSREEYLARLAHIEDIPRLSTAQRELAERFACGTFLLRPLPLETVSFKFHQDFGAENRFLATKINVGGSGGWQNAPDLRAIAQWINEPTQLDFLRSPRSALQRG